MKNKLYSRISIGLKIFIQVFLILSSINMFASNIDTIRLASSNKLQKDRMIKDLLIIESGFSNDTVLFDESNIFYSDTIVINSQFEVWAYNTVESRKSIYTKFFKIKDKWGISNIRFEDPMPGQIHLGICSFVQEINQWISLDSIKSFFQGDLWTHDFSELNCTSYYDCESTYSVEELRDTLNSYYSMDVRFPCVEEEWYDYINKYHPVHKANYAIYLDIITFLIHFNEPEIALFILEKLEEINNSCPEIFRLLSDVYRIKNEINMATKFQMKYIEMMEKAAKN